MEFFPIKPESFGIEISDSAVRIAKLKSNGKFFDLESWGEEKIDSGVVRGGEIKNGDALTEAIKKTLREINGEKIRTKYLVASLPESKSFLRVIRMPKMTEAELQSAVPFEAENYIPFPIEDVYLDFQVVNADSLSQQVLIVACPRLIVDSYLALFKKADLFPIIFEVESMAVCRALIGREDLSSPLAILDVGEAKADFIIFSRGAVRFTSSFPMGNQDFSLLAEQVKKYLDYYRSHPVRNNISNGAHYPAEEEVGRILLSGEMGNLKKLAGSLSEDLKIKTEPGNPLVNILPKDAKPPLSAEDSLNYTTVLGLALRSQLTTDN